MERYIKYFKSPVGILKITASDSSILSLTYTDEKDIENNGKENKIIKDVIQQLEEYFRGERKKFDIKYEFSGTEFQKKVWKSLEQIPYGETCSYKYIASDIGNEKASRAVGNANNKNHLSIIVPCHRVIGANQKLIGYAGGLEKKSILLELEKKYK